MTALNRDALSNGKYLLSFKDTPGIEWWPRERIEASMHAMLARRPGPDPVWLFAYGSLIWNPQFYFDESIPAALEGWRRSFSMRLVAGRGSIDQPGRMLTLSPGGHTKGLALRLNEETLEPELGMVWLREMVGGAYQPNWASLALADGRTVQAIVFTANPESILHELDDSIETVTPLIATAHGILGSNRDYVVQLNTALQEYGLNDDYIQALAARLEPLPPQ